ncbi:Hypothetical protein NGAL_HAMBI490_39540 [Neorhizobium galegae bv. officinalis]|nr:Hypothetical protein NGAL_HAMBI490_39540 [Neorhizobium galegae bv. officinalis]
MRDHQDVNVYVAQGIALGRVGQPDDVGRALAAILSGDPEWANGTTFDISAEQVRDDEVTLTTTCEKTR